MRTQWFFNVRKAIVLLKLLTVESFRNCQTKAAQQVAHFIPKKKKKLVKRSSLCFFFSWYGFFCKAESCLCCHAAGVCNDFINDRKHAVILEHNCLKQKRVLCDTLYINVCHMIGRGEYEGKLVPEVEMNCIEWNFAVFFYVSLLGCAPYGPLHLERTTRFSRVRHNGDQVALGQMSWFEFLVLPQGSCCVCNTWARSEWWAFSVSILSDHEY